MVLKADQERVRTLLKDTITLLCKNGLSFNSKFSVDALIGVTVDEDDVFLISIRELVKNERSADFGGTESSEAESEGQTAQKRKRRKRRRSKIKTGENSAGEENSESEGLQHQDAPNGDSSANEDEPSTKRQQVQVKKEQCEDSSDDIVLVKTEMDDNWSQHTQENANQSSMYQNTTGQINDGSMFQDDQNFSSLSGLDLVPVSQDESGPSWSQGMPVQHQQPRQYRPRVSITNLPSTSSSQGQPLSQDPQNPDQSQDRCEPQYTCDTCAKTFCSKYTLRKHMMLHSGDYRFFCEMCGKGYMGMTDLIHHKKSHIGQKDHQCALCGKRYVQKSTLTHHMKIAH